MEAWRGCQPQALALESASALHHVVGLGVCVSSRSVFERRLGGYCACSALQMCEGHGRGDCFTVCPVELGVSGTGQALVHGAHYGERMRMMSAYTWVGPDSWQRSTGTATNDSPL